MQTHLNASLVKLAVVLLGLLTLMVASTAVLAQEGGGEWNLAENDGRLNVNTFMGGANVYCVDQWHSTATTYANGGGFLVLDPQGQEMLFVPEATINAAFEEMARTGQYVTLGVSERGWYAGRPIAIYLLTSNEFQMNAGDDQNKPVEFRWTECLNVTIQTSDGCQPSWDRDQYGNCVHINLY